ncbi:MAG TPA: AraC family transcriptional regulator [Pyrinomonadaceae bacterium]|nr:AraC family transcriptional regulator [Pyrinomonadaceae bacterium]
MEIKQLSSDKSSFQAETEDGGILTRRKTEFLPDGAYYFEDQLEIKEDFSVKIVLCAAWLFELYELEAGELFFVRGAEKISPKTKRFGIFYPPFTISQPFFKQVKGKTRGIAAEDFLPEEFPIAPLLFETDFTESFSGAAQVREILKTGRNPQSVELNPKPSLLSLKAKRLIDENYHIYPSIARIAARLNVSHEHLTRQFKRDYDLTPSAYLHQIRIADATFRLAKGEEIINVSQDVGYNDLSRFYKQFRKSMETSPGNCQMIKKD